MAAPAEVGEIRTAREMTRHHILVVLQAAKFGINQEEEVRGADIKDKVKESRAERIRSAEVLKDSGSVLRSEQEERKQHLQKVRSLNKGSVYREIYTLERRGKILSRRQDSRNPLNFLPSRKIYRWPH